mmetsp:Transcript_38395/g.98188  ORF Transcript_38395/g.98188 Transcript_38395/m.98188 type:complete len:209 (-) Transcript_38395:133-759(-)
MNTMSSSSLGSSSKLSSTKGGSKISKSTQDLVEKMMKESGVNHRKAELLKNAMQGMGSLPVPKAYQPQQTAPQPARTRALNPHNSDRGRKTAGTIGREVARNPVRLEAPTNKGMDRDLEREKLARHFQFDGEVPQVAPRAKAAPAAEQSQEAALHRRFADLMGQVEEGQAFLEQMKAAGQSQKYSQTVNSDIASKVREMMDIDAKLGR